MAKNVRKGSGTHKKKSKSTDKPSGDAKSPYYFGGLKKVKIKDAPVYGWPGP